MIYKEKPTEFNQKFSVVSCYVENDGDILLLHRQDHKPEGGTWGLPAGKIDEGEREVEAMRRELKEETGLDVEEIKFQYLVSYYVKYPTYHFIYHSFRLELKEKPLISLRDKEHKDFCWLKPRAALELSLVPDLDACILDIYFKKQ